MPLVRSLSEPIRLSVAICRVSLQSWVDASTPSIGCGMGGGSRSARLLEGTFANFRSCSRGLGAGRGPSGRQAGTLDSQFADCGQALERRGPGQRTERAETSSTTRRNYLYLRRQPDAPYGCGLCFFSSKKKPDLRNSMSRSFCFFILHYHGLQRQKPQSASTAANRPSRPVSTSLRCLAWGAMEPFLRGDEFTWGN